MTSTDDGMIRLLNQVRRHKGHVELAAVSDESRLREDLLLDSLDLAELTVRIEERFGVDVFREGIVSQWGQVRSRVHHHVENKPVG